MKFLISGYENGGKSTKYRNKFISREISGSVAKNARRGAMNGLLKLGDAVADAVSNTSTKTFGATFLTFGLITLISYFIREYISLESESQGVALVSGIVCSILAIPCLLLDRPISRALQDNPVSDCIIYEFFCIKRSTHGRVNFGIHPVFGIVFAALVGILGYFVPLSYVLLTVGVLAFVYVSFLSPEFPFLLSILVMPYVSLIPYSETVISFIIVTAAISLFRKVIYGKRVLFFEQYDIYLLIMMTGVLISGIFIKGIEAFGDSVFLIITALGYSVTGNLVINRRLSDRCMHAFIIASVPSALISAWMAVSLLLSGNDGVSLILEVKSTFYSADSLAVFMTATVFFAYALAKQSKGLPRVAYFAIALFDFASVILSGELFFAVAIFLGILITELVRSKWAALISTVLFVASPYGIFLLPTSVSEKLFRLVPEIADLQTLISLWKSSADAFLSNLWLGIGIGSESFILEMERYEIFGFDNSCNLLLEIGLEAGAVALFAFAVLIVIRLCHRFNYNASVRNSSVEKQSPLIINALFALIFAGAFNFLWSYTPSSYVFWCVFGLGSATLRIARREKDDKKLYYDDTRTPDQSEISVDIG